MSNPEKEYNNDSIKHISDILVDYESVSKYLEDVLATQADAKLYLAIKDICESKWFKTFR